MKAATLIYLFILLGVSACSAERMPTSENADSLDMETFNYTYLALGDSYTLGQSVCSSCNFPQQLLDSINQLPNRQGVLSSIAQTGWTTTRLLTEMDRINPPNTYDLVSLLIGVNNQFLEKPFSVFEVEFPQLVDRAIALAKGETERIIVLSVPDYVFTPFGQTLSNPQQVSEEIDRYNSYAQTIATGKGVTFINITDISRKGIDQPELVSSDGLHLSTLAYTQFVERLFPRANRILTAN